MNRFIILTIAALVFVQTAHAADPAASCESRKLKASGKYVSCLLGAEAKGVLRGSTPDYTKCSEKIAKSWSTAEAKGAGQCPNGDDDQGALQSFLDACSQSTAGTLGGTTPLPPDSITCETDLTTCTNDLATCDVDLLACDADLLACDADLATCDGGLLACDGELSACEGDLAACEALPAVLKTGQTICYDAVGAVIDCDLTGQDGEFELGAARSFTVNDNGTITDNVTGLMWEKLSYDGSIHDKDDAYTWADAFESKVATLNSESFAGYDDWRLPNRFELETIVNASTYNPGTYSAFNTGCVAGCTVLTCSCTRSSYYWSSTTHAGDPTYAWLVGLFAGGVGDNVKSNPLYVRAVRGGS